MPQIDIKIQSVADLAALKRAIDEVGRGEAAVRRFKAEGSGVGELFRLGFGIGSGVELARRGLDLFKATVTDTARHAFDMADQIKNGAEALGISRQAYQVLGQVMREAGGEQERMSQAIATNNRSLIEARTQAGAAAAAYRTLGLSPAALEGLSVERRLQTIARAIDGAKDKTQAFAAAGDILGTKNLPVLLSALRQLGTEGYDALAASAEKAGKIMSDDTIARLERAKKAIEDIKRKITIDVGESISALGVLKESAQKETGATLLGFLRAALFNDYSALAKTVIKNVPSVTAPPDKATVVDNTQALENERKLVALKTAKLELTRLEVNFEATQSSIHLTDEEKRQKEITYLDSRFKILKKIYDLTKSLPLDGKDPIQRSEELARLNAQIISAASDETNLSAPLSDKTIRDRRFQTFTEGSNAQGGRQLSPTEGLTAGLQDFLTQSGPIGEQVATTLTSTIGAAVHGISDGIYGWLTGTQTWGQAMLQMGRSILKGIIDQVVQIGIQQIINGNIFRAVMLGTNALSDTLRAGRVAKDNAAEAATLPLKTAGAAAAGISSYGVALAFGAIAIALIAAAASGFEVGGYTSDGPSNKPAGIVHAGEWVAPQWMAKHPTYGPLIQSLEAARTGRGYETGGWVPDMDAIFQQPAPAYRSLGSTPAAQSSGALSSNGGGVTIPLNFLMSEGAPRPSDLERLRTQEGRKFLIETLKMAATELT